MSNLSGQLDWRWRDRDAKDLTDLYSSCSSDTNRTTQKQALSFPEQTPESPTRKKKKKKSDAAVERTEGSEWGV